MRGRGGGGRGRSLFGLVKRISHCWDMSVDESEIYPGGLILANIHTFTLYTLHSTLYTLHSTLYTLHYTLYTLHSTLYTLHSTLYTLHSTLHSKHSAHRLNKRVKLYLTCTQLLMLPGCLTAFTQVTNNICITFYDNPFFDLSFVSHFNLTVSLSIVSDILVSSFKKM